MYMFILIPACTNECTRVCLYLGIYRPGLWPCYSDFSRWGLAQNITNSDQRVPILVWCCMCPKGSGKETWLQCTCIYVKSVYKDVYIYIYILGFRFQISPLLFTWPIFRTRWFHPRIRGCSMRGPKSPGGFGYFIGWFDSLVGFVEHP